MISGVRSKWRGVALALVLTGGLLGAPAAASTPVAFPEFGLPMAAGQNTYSAGVHSDNGTSGVRNAIDFSPGDGVVRAARAGVVRLQRCSGGDWVAVDHSDGWRTGYYHLENITVRDGEQVAAGARLGDSGNALPCGGRSTGAHVHFTLWQLSGNTMSSTSEASSESAALAEGNWDGVSYDRLSTELAAVYGEPVDGKTFGGWRFAEGAEQYGGTATRLRDAAVVQLPGRFRYDG
ncbi:LasA protease [Amycolatopsis marina]|uniref:LasA protease n=1 Tax=Amycolatopsis marina TaxID=490629 RepID=A0A1I1AKY0_9PSEU|nr:M23 family metallopeptidase [Amycolatopsis marina]SFB38607.1 LasA protease [Amycolatopsis marina]